MSGYKRFKPTSIPDGSLVSRGSAVLELWEEDGVPTIVATFERLEGDLTRVWRGSFDRPAGLFATRDAAQAFARRFAEREIRR